MTLSGVLLPRIVGALVLLGIVFAVVLIAIRVNRPDAAARRYAENMRAGMQQVRCNSAGGCIPAIDTPHVMRRPS